MKPIGYLLTSLSVAGLLSIAVAAQSAEKATTDKALTEKTAAAKTDADKPDCEGADRHHGDRRHNARHGARGDHFAHGGPGREGGREGGRGAPLEKILGLTDAQQKTLETARETERANAVALREKVVAAQDAIFKAANTNASDEELNKLAANSAGLHAQLELGRIKMHRQLVALLTPEQKQKLTDWEANHKPGRRAPI